MLSSLHRLSTENLKQLADALRSGWVAPPFSSFLLRNFVPDALAAGVAADLQAATEAGIPAPQLAEVMQLLMSDRGQHALAEGLIDLVWTGPDVPGIVNRDTGVVVREMFRSARQSVLLAGYAVYQGRVIFRALAEQMDQNSQLRVEMFLDVQRSWNDCSSAAELVRRFGERFIEQEWPGSRLPKLFYDPRSLDSEACQRACLHAKCVVVDRQVALVSSANFTEAAHLRNIEVGALLRLRSFASKLADHFEELVNAGVLLPVFET
jgi:phosphatidylserine/phosphatidylglycerophosphate/cardiolipin synthase-like enzyme